MVLCIQIRIDEAKGNAPISRGIGQEGIRCSSSQYAKFKGQYATSQAGNGATGGVL